MKKSFFLKIFAIIIAVALIICMAPSVFAANEKSQLSEVQTIRGITCKVFTPSENSKKNRFNDKFVKVTGEKLYAGNSKITYNCYSALNEIQKKFYDAIVSVANDFIIFGENEGMLVAEKVPYKDVKIAYRDMELAYVCVLADHPEIFWLQGLGMGYDDYLNGTYDLFIQLSYNIPTKSERDSKLAALNQKVNELVSAAEGMADFDKEVFFHDYICNNNSYGAVDEEFCFTCYGALVQGKSVCEGYAEALQLLLNASGINCMTVRGSNTEYVGHMWNIVELPTGWYEFDATWDDAGDIKTYNYFNLTEAQMDYSHIKSINYTQDSLPDGEFPSTGDVIDSFNFNLPSAAHTNIGGKIQGTETSFGSKDETVNIKVYVKSTGVLFTQLSVKGNKTDYSFMKLPAADYVLEISKKNHAKRKYDVSLVNSAVKCDAKIHLIGDITGDGQVNIIDFGRLSAHVLQTSVLTGYAYDVANVDGKGTVNNVDLSRLIAHINQKSLLF